MKNMKRLGLASILVASLAGVALAGVKNTIPVTVVPAKYEAYGAMGSARNSADAIQYIGCQTISYSNGDALLSCSARSAAGVAGSCSIHNPPASMTQGLANASSDSYLDFFWDANGTCTVLIVYNFSYTEPKR